MTESPSIDSLTERVQLALSAPGCERLAEWAAIGPVQRAAVEQFASGLLPEGKSIDGLMDLVRACAMADCRAILAAETEDYWPRARERDEAFAAIRAYAEPLLDVDALHGAIMNIQCKPRWANDRMLATAYSQGHRDARHAAAELVNAAKK